MSYRNRLVSAAADTNLFVSGSIIKRDHPHLPLLAWRCAAFTLAISDQQRAEAVKRSCADLRSPRSQPSFASSEVTDDLVTGDEDLLVLQAHPKLRELNSPSKFSCTPPTMKNEPDLPRCPSEGLAALAHLHPSATWLSLPPETPLDVRARVYRRIPHLQTRNAREGAREIVAAVTQGEQMIIPVELLRLLGLKPRDKAAIDDKWVCLPPATFTLEQACGSVQWLK